MMVLNNRDLNLVSWEQRAIEGDPAATNPRRRCPIFRTPNMPSCSASSGIRVDEPEAVGPAWDEALDASRPTIVEMVTDPDVPPLPPRITFDQAASLLKAILKGDPDAAEIIRHSMRELAASV